MVRAMGGSDPPEHDASVTAAIIMAMSLNFHEIVSDRASMRIVLSVADVEGKSMWFPKGCRS